MSFKDWWLEIKELFVVPPEPKEPPKPFYPPHASRPEGKPQPKWPSKEDRQ